MDQTVRQRAARPVSGQTSAWTFFLLVFLLSAPFVVAGALYGEAWERISPITLPLSALMFVVPLVAAAILTYRDAGPAGAKALLRRAFDHQRIQDKRWYVVILGFWPAVMVVEYGLMRLMGVPLPEFEFAAWLVPVFLAVFFIGGIGEELGWTGFATDQLQERYSALQAALIIGAVWALLHIPADLQTDHGLTWILWQRLGTIVRRILFVWLYNNAGKSVFATVLFHDLDNVSAFMFPNYGSHYDPFLTLLIMAVVAAPVIVVWGPRTLARTTPSS